ncbi:MAG: SDR family NAD(P)-dependent oxidoreductase [Herpetosiphon sp.]|nr:SDR family NAD(P)-dependent oxidoreductase [Herpetosiphon sp.]
MNKSPKVALVTGASRGVGKGIACALGEHGYTVYLTGRSVSEAARTVPLDGTIYETAHEVTARGGQGIALICDHADDHAVQTVFDTIRQQHGQLDLLVNNAWGGYEGLHRGTSGGDGPFWEHRLSEWDEMFIVGVRSAYIASVFAIPLMIETGGGLIVNISYFAGLRTFENVAYGVAKAAVDRMSRDFAHHLRPHNITAVSLYPGLVRTEGVMRFAEYLNLSNSESPEFQGRAIVALANDPDRIAKSGEILISAELAQEYNFTDIDGKRPYSLRPFPQRWEHHNND